MTKDEALRLALDALEKISMGGDPRWADEAITAINETLETEEGLLDRKSYLLGLYDQKSRVGIETKDEPVAWGMEKDGVILDVISPDEHDREEGSYTVPLYTTPQRTWVGLTEEDLKPICDEWRIVYGAWVHDFARDIEAKLRRRIHE